MAGEPEPQAALKTFRTKSGGHVRIWWAPYNPPLDVHGGEQVSFEANSEEARVLRECPEIEEVKDRPQQLPEEG